MSKKILIIDDDKDLSKEMSDLLREEGHSVKERLYDPAGLIAFRPQEYDIIILDFKMPGLTGADILNAIPRGLPSLKVFVLSGRPFVEKILQQEGLMSKVTEIIPKPFSIQDFLAKINAV